MKRLLLLSALLVALSTHTFVFAQGDHTGGGYVQGGSIGGNGRQQGSGHSGGYAQGGSGAGNGRSYGQGGAGNNGRTKQVKSLNVEGGHVGGRSKTKVAASGGETGNGYEGGTNVGGYC